MNDPSAVKQGDYCIPQKENKSGCKNRMIFSSKINKPFYEMDCG